MPGKSLNRNKNRLFIRIDDACPKMEHDTFWAFVNYMKSREIKGIIGVVPDCLDTKLNKQEEDNLFWDKIIKLQNDGWVIAMHGVHHVYTQDNWGIVAKRKKSEFAGLSFQNQLKLLKQGQDLLASKGINTKVFFAPGHSYDNNTIRALKKLGFEYISDGRSQYPYIKNGIIFMPCKIYGSPKKIKGFVTVAVHPCEESFSIKVFDKWIDDKSDYLNKCSFYLDKKEVSGFNGYYQRLSETCFVFYERYIHMFLSRVKRLLMQYLIK